MTTDLERVLYVVSALVVAIATAWFVRQASVLADTWAVRLCRIGMTVCGFTVLIKMMVVMTHLPPYPFEFDIVIKFSLGIALGGFIIALRRLAGRW